MGERGTERILDTKNQNERVCLFIANLESRYDAWLMETANLHLHKRHIFTP